MEQCDGCSKEGQPAASPPSWGSGHPPHHLQTQSSLRPGPWDLQLLPQSRLAWESPRGRLIVPLLHFSSAALFPLSASYKLQRLHRKVWLPPGPLPRRRWAQVSCWQGRLHNQVPPRLSQNPGSLPGLWGAGYKAVLSLGHFVSWCLGLWAHAPCSGRHAQFLQVSTPWSLDQPGSMGCSFLLREAQACLLY